MEDLKVLARALLHTTEFLRGSLCNYLWNRLCGPRLGKGRRVVWEVLEHNQFKPSNLSSRYIIYMYRERERERES